MSSRQGFLFCFLVLSLAVAQADAAQLCIVLDPGHHPGKDGALGVRGIHEVVYNDALTGRLAQALEAQGYAVHVTRGPAQEIGLGERARFANNLNADLFLAIHHDSAQPKYLERIQVDGRDAWRTIKPIAGYSLFVSLLNPQAARSKEFGLLLGAEMNALGRPPTLHHAEAIPGENRELLDRELGLYRFDDLIVLKKTQMPAVLLEIGVIVDPVDEAYVSDEGNQTMIINAIVNAVRSYSSLIASGKRKPLFQEGDGKGKQEGRQ